MSSIKKDDFKKVTVVSQGKFKANVRLKPHINEILSSAYHVVNDQLRILARRSEAGEELDGAEIRKFNGLVESASRLSREEREQAKAFDPAQLDDDELLLYVKKAEELLGDGTKDSKEDSED